METQTREAKVQSMFEAGAHVGYSRARRHPSTAPYVFARKNQTEIIDLEKTADLLARAEAFAAECGRTGRSVLFVAGKPEAREATRRAAESAGQPYVIGRWIGGTLTNFAEIKKRIDELETLRTQRENGELAQKYTKLEQLMIDRDIARLENRFGGLVGLTKRPDALFIIDPNQETIAVAEAQKTQTPIVALASSDADIRGITYPIIANETLQSSIRFFTDAIAHAYRNAQSSKTKATTDTKVVSE